MSSSYRVNYRAARSVYASIKTATVEAASYDAAADAVRDPAPWGCLGEHTRDTYRGLATAALRVVTERADGAL